MTLVLELSRELEARLNAESIRRGKPREECVLELLATSLPETPIPSTPAEWVGELEREGVIGIWEDRNDIPDSPEYARQLRQQAENRAASGP